MEDLFRKNGIPYLQKLEQTKLLEFYHRANDAYFNSSNPILSDSEFDLLKDFVQEHYPNSICIGAPVMDKKVKLPFFMGSMNKIKSNPDNWLKSFQGPYVISAKLDGVSALFDNRDKPQLYTRGDGFHGQNISFLIPYLGLDEIQPKCVFRGECIVAKSFSNIEKKRNFVSGVLNSKKPQRKKMEVIHFVPYEIVDPPIKPSEQMKILQQHFDKVVSYDIIPKINESILSNYLKEWRESNMYEIDGVICTNDAIYPREQQNPSHSFAFKMILENQMVEAVVMDVLWNITKDGYIKPKVKFSPVHIQGVRIEYATAFNASFIKRNKIGMGTVVQLVRSGDVIPHIHKVLSCSETPKFPHFPYEWTETKVDIVVKNRHENQNVMKEKIVFFFQGLCIDGLGKNTIHKIIEKGYTTIPMIMSMKKDDFLLVDGIQEKTAIKLFDGIKKKVQNVSLAKLLALSNCFDRGFGEKKLQLVFEHFPHWYKESNFVEKISSLKGFSDSTAQQFVSGIRKSLLFLKETNLNYKLVPFKLDITDKRYENKLFVFSGFRDGTLEKKIQAMGGKVSDTVNKSTFQLIVNDLSNETSKVKKAKELGIKIISKNNFIL